MNEGRKGQASRSTFVIQHRDRFFCNAGYNYVCLTVAIKIAKVDTPRVFVSFYIGSCYKTERSTRTVVQPETNFIGGQSGIGDIRFTVIIEITDPYVLYWSPHSQSSNRSRSIRTWCTLILYYIDVGVCLELTYNDLRQSVFVKIFYTETFCAGGSRNGDSYRRSGRK